MTKYSSQEASASIFIKDLINKKIVEETDLMIIEDKENTKCTTVQDFVRSMIKDNDVPTRYRIYSSEKIQKMIDELENLLNTGIGSCHNEATILAKNKADKRDLESLRDALIAEIDERANTEEMMEIINSKRDKSVKIKAEDLDTSSDENKLGIENFSQEVLDYMTGAKSIPSNRPPKGGWVTEDIADGAINFNKLAEDYRYGGHFTEGNINEFIKDGIYTLGPDVLGLPKDSEDDNSQIRLLTVETTENGIVKQKLEYVNDIKYHPIYRRVSSINRLRITEFIRVEEINDKFKAHRDTLSDDFNNCGTLSNCDIFSIRREGHYFADGTVTGLPVFGDSYEIDIRKFNDRIVYQAINMGNNKCDIYQAMQYYTNGSNPVNTQWYNTNNYSRSKFENKTVHLFGDGIIFGLGSSDIPSKSIPALLSNKYGMKITNNALGNATAGSYGDETLSERSLVTQVSLDTMKNVDYAIIMIGTHDWDCSKAIIGKNNYASDASFKGALNWCIQNILEKNPFVKILLVSPVFRSRKDIGDNKNSDDHMLNDLYLQDFAIAMGEIAEYNHVPFINLYSTSGINKYNSGTYLSDGLYLNDSGHDLIATKIVDGMDRYY